ncbi:hypothetical protein RIR_e49567_A0A2I1E3A3_9GLOM [Rhizophagus irregularis DAOM 181602=DAOM 197198]|nr:hypothetical protein RhiirB3_47653 [Rhizophagus irregularis]GET62134.1 hypothetical protein RIR_e49567_A0A2I1E3A3_9GLOM [Rhizophagus irregularis DAOM 181602=DAOM 197198]
MAPVNPSSERIIQRIIMCNLINTYWSITAVLSCWIPPFVINSFYLEDKFHRSRKILPFFSSSLLE